MTTDRPTPSWRQRERRAHHLDLVAAERGALTFVVVGGGPTGVEMAVALRELFEKVLAADFPELDVSQARVILAEAGDALLAPYSPDLRAYALREVRERGVEAALVPSVLPPDLRQPGTDPPPGSVSTEHRGDAPPSLR